MTQAGADDAERLATEAKLATGSGDHAGAAALHRAAVALSAGILDELALDPDTDPRERRAAAHSLADHWGRLGGALRRAGGRREALDAYRNGAALERDWKLDDTYNRTNAITLELLLHPQRLDELQPEVHDVAGLVRGQVQGPRRRESWAWADLGLLSLFAGRDREATQAYQIFASLRPMRVYVNSTLDVLQEVRDGVVTTHPDRAEAFDAAIEQVRAPG